MSAETETLAAWSCAALRYQGQEPQDCNWPHCGCDPKATEVLQALDEHGYDLVDRHRRYPGLAMSDAELDQHFEASKRDVVLVGSEIRQIIGELRFLRALRARPTTTGESGL